MARSPSANHDFGTGEDAVLLPFLAAGCYGVVAFVSHVVGQEIRFILDAFADKDFDRAFASQALVTDVALDLFTVPNPIRLKAVLTELASRQGQPGRHCRLTVPWT